MTRTPSTAVLRNAVTPVDSNRASRAVRATASVVASPASTRPRRTVELGLPELDVLAVGGDVRVRARELGVEAAEGVPCEREFAARPRPGAARRAPTSRASGARSHSTSDRSSLGGSAASSASRPVRERGALRHRRGLARHGVGDEEQHLGRMERIARRQEVAARLVGRRAPSPRRRRPTRPRRRRRRRAARARRAECPMARCGPRAGRARTTRGGSTARPAASAPARAARYAWLRSPARSKWSEAWTSDARRGSPPNSAARAWSRRSSPAWTVPYSASRSSWWRKS